MSEKKKVGRPKKGLDVLPNGWKDTMIDLASQGASQSEVQNVLGMDDNLWYKFIEREPEFRETFTRAKRACKAWWERHGRINLENPHFNNALWAFNMKNRFQWRDRQPDEIDKAGAFEPIVIDLPNANRKIQIVNKNKKG